MVTYEACTTAFYRVTCKWADYVAKKVTCQHRLTVFKADNEITLNAYRTKLIASC